MTPVNIVYLDGATSGTSIVVTGTFNAEVTVNDANISNIKPDFSPNPSAEKGAKAFSILHSLTE